jgi:hypothetical protein
MMQQWARVLRATPCGHRPGCPVSLTDPATRQPSTDSVHGPYRATKAAVYADRPAGRQYTEPCLQLGVVIF